MSDFIIGKSDYQEVFYTKMCSLFFAGRIYPSMKRRYYQINATYQKSAWVSWKRCSFKVADRLNLLVFSVIIASGWKGEIAMKTVLVIDGQGGGIGKSLTERIKRAYPDCFVIAVGTNSMATAAMLKAGADAGATGENAVVVNASRADVIAGPIGIAFADAMFGEITERMAAGIARSNAYKVFLPTDKCKFRVAGCQASSLTQCLDDAVKLVGQYLNGL